MPLSILDALPTELLVLILHQCEVVSLLRCRLTNSLLKTLIDRDVSLHYKVALHVAGMEDGPASSAVSPRQRLDMLREQQLAWSKLQFSGRQRVLELGGGIWELYGNVLAQGKDENTLRFLRLPSVSRGIPSTDRWEVKVDFTIRDFAMDPSQDLLVLLEVWRSTQPLPDRWRSRIHLMSLSTGERHKAAQAQLELSIPHLGRNWTYTIQTCGEYLGILYTPPSTAPARDRIAIFNWRSGAIHMDYEHEGLDSFAFLTPPHIVLGVASHTGPYEGEDDEDPPVLRPPSLDVFTFANYSGDPLPDGQPRLLGSLLYPQPCVGNQPFAMSIRTDPGVPWAPSHELCVPFHVARAARVFVIKFYVFNGAAKPVLSFVPLAVLDAHAARMAAAGAEPADVPWADWGPAGSRMLLNVLSSDVWVCHVFGTRFATAHPRGRRVVRVTLFDFNTRAYAHGRRFQPAVSPQADDADWTEPVDMPGGFAAHPRAKRGTNIEEQGPLIPEAEGSWQYIGADDRELEGAQEIFAEPVRTRLPYRKLCKDIAITGPGLLHRKVAVQLAEDNLLLVHLGESERHIEILTF